MVKLITEPISTEQLEELREVLPAAEIAVFDTRGNSSFCSSRHSIPLITGHETDGFVVRVGHQTKTGTVVIETPWGEAASGLRNLANVLAVNCLVVTFLATMVAWSASGRVLRPVTELIDSAEIIASHPNLGLLETTDRAEFMVLVDSLNRLVNDIRRSAIAQEQFAADAAHEFKTPLALLRLKLESSLNSSHSVEDFLLSEQAMLEQVDRLSELVESLLASAKSEHLVLHPISLDNVVRLSTAKWCEQSGWSQENLVLVSSCHEIEADEVAVDLIVNNLLRNAAAHADSGSFITVEVLDDVLGPRISVINEGEPIADEDRERIFDRLYRTDRARDRQRGGAGIGLAIVKKLVDQLGATVSYDSAGRQNRFTVYFKRVT